MPTARTAGSRDGVVVDPLEVAGPAELDLPVEQQADVCHEDVIGQPEPRPGVELPLRGRLRTNRVKGPTSTASAIGRGTAS